MEIAEIIARAKRYGEIQTIRRKIYAPYEMETAMRVFECIGKQFAPGFVVDNDNRWVYEQLIKWIMGDATMQAIDPTTGAIVQGNLTKGIYLAGNTGSGKSLALQVLSIYRRVDNIKIVINEEVVNLNYRPIRVDEICDAYAKTGDISKYKRMPILCIQDFGSEETTTLHMGNRINVMQQIIESRGDRHDLITLISSNQSIGNPKLDERYGKRVVSRLNEMCNYIVLKGSDRRTKERITLTQQQ